MRDMKSRDELLGAFVGRPHDQVALRDARGIRFQRLEFLGDAVLDLLALRHETMWKVADARPDCCHTGWFSPTDHALGQIAQRSGLVALADWPLAAGRAADLVEACVAVVFNAHGWPGAERFAAAAIHPIDLIPALPITHRVEDDRSVCELGAQVLEACFTMLLFSRYRTEDEGALSARRAVLMRNSHRAGVARMAGLAKPSRATAGAGADQLDRHIGSICLGLGIEAAINAAVPLLRPGTIEQ